MPRRPATPEETPLRLDADLNVEELNPHPRQVRRWFSSNIVQRTISLLCGWTGKRPRPVEVSETGLLYTASVSVPLLHQKVFAGQAGDAYGSDLIFPEPVDRVDIFVFDYALVFKRAAPDGLYEEEVEVPANSMYSFDAVTAKIAVKNKTAGQVSRYQIVGWY
ncbi:MAG: hypothetical protein H5U03_00185 [Clostridia bacterium]|nr:hypothetical protein [Clostridia bacterium]